MQQNQSLISFVSVFGSTVERVVLLGVILEPHFQSERRPDHHCLTESLLHSFQTDLQICVALVNLHGRELLAT